MSRNHKKVLVPVFWKEFCWGITFKPVNQQTVTFKPAGNENSEENDWFAKEEVMLLQDNATYTVHKTVTKITEL